MAEPPSAVVLGFDVGVSKAVVAYAPAGATSFGAELVRLSRHRRLPKPLPLTPRATNAGAQRNQQRDHAGAPQHASTRARAEADASAAAPPPFAPPRQTAVAFQGKERHVGDVAVGQLGTNAANAIAGLLPLLGLPLEAAAASDAFSRARLEAAPEGGAAARVSYMGDDVPLRAEQLTAMLLARLAAHAAAASGNATVRRCVLSCPPAFTPRQRRALLDAAVAAGLPSPSLLPAHAAAASCFGVKRPSVEGAPPRRVAFCDVGQHYASVAVYDFAFRAAPRLLASGGEALGAGDLDEALWELCAAELRDKHRIDVTKASRGGGRLLAEVVKAKRTLSTVASATIELECFGPDEKDVKLAITRDRFDAACAPLRERLESFLRATFAAAAAAASDDTPITAVEVIGGAARVPWVAAAIATAAGAPLSHMLDGACSCALGAAFAAQAHIDDRAFPAAFPPPVVAPDDETALPAGLDADALASLRSAELDMARADAEAAALADAWNELEAYVLEMRACASSGPLAADLQPAATLPLLAAAEDWMLDARDSGEDVPLADVRKRLEDVRSKLHELAPGYFAKLAAQKAALEVRSLPHARLSCVGMHTSNQARPHPVAGPDIVKC